MKTLYAVADIKKSTLVSFGTVLFSCRVLTSQGWCDSAVIQKISTGYRVGYKLNDGGKIADTESFATISELKKEMTVPR